MGERQNPLLVSLPHAAIPTSKLESGAISYLGLDVRFGSEADI